MKALVKKIVFTELGTMMNLKVHSVSMFHHLILYNPFEAKIKIKNWHLIKVINSIKVQII